MKPKRFHLLKSASEILTSVINLISWAQKGARVALMSDAKFASKKMISMRRSFPKRNQKSAIAAWLAESLLSRVFASRAKTANQSLQPTGLLARG